MRKTHENIKKSWKYAKIVKNTQKSLKIGHETGLEKASGALVKPSNKKKGVLGRELGPEA